ncbi:unnamed protein product [Lactuca saligna]|uniref:Uncharacterized protein n=1 Tax=Lactuca saligna TaxID=75948 RepID=A0AA36E515_LACSI|nr:unnamed protein product [Lactuca saligna]
MGFGSLLRMKTIDIPLKIVYYVLDHFNFETLKVDFENCQVSVDSKFVHEMLGLPYRGSLLSNMDYISENNEESFMFEWKKQYGNIDKLRLKQLRNELVRTSAADDNFRINFLVLFINTFYESTSMGKCNLNQLYLIRRDTDLSSIDWCNFIVNCLVMTKKVYNPEKKPSFFYGPTTYLMIRFLENSLQENGGFGCGDVSETYVEEESQESEYNEEKSDDDEDEFDGDEDLSGEDEEEFDVNKVSVVEVLEKNEFDDGTINLGEDDHNKEVMPDRTVEKVIVEKKKKDELIHPSLLKGFSKVLVEISKAKKDVEGVVEETTKECLQIIQRNDSNETQSLKTNKAEGKVEKFYDQTFSPRFSQDSQGSKKVSQSQSSLGRMTKKKNKDRVYLGKPIVGSQCVVPNVDVIDASPVSFAPPLGTLEVPSNPISDQVIVINEKSPSKAKSDKPKDINVEGTSEVDVKGKSEMKFCYDYKSPFKERLIDFKPSLTQVEFFFVNGFSVFKEIQDIMGFRANYKSNYKKTYFHVSVFDSWSRILNHEEKFRDVTNSPVRLFISVDTTFPLEYNHIKEIGKYKVFKDNISISVSGDRDL